jgi:hypothetical protein
MSACNQSVPWEFLISGLGHHVDALTFGKTHIRLALVGATARTIAERLGLALALTTLTASTLTLKSCSIAAFTSALVAVEATSNTYWFDSARRAVFSDTRGARSTP